MASSGVAHPSDDAVVLGKLLAVWTTEAIVSAPVVALVLHQEQETATCMSEMAEPSFRVNVFAAPPGKYMAAKCCEITSPVRASAPIVGFIFVSPVSKNVCDFSHCCEGNKVEARFCRQGLVCY